MKKDFRPPEKTKLDHLHTGARAGLAAVPIAGGSAAEIFGAVLQSPYESRLSNWRKMIEEELERLNSNGAAYEAMATNENFVSTVAYASQIALRTHRNEKLEALKAAVVNAALGTRLEEDLQHFFLNLVDEFTPRHLAILAFFQTPEAPSNLTMGGLSSVLENQFPDLKGKREFYDQIWRDLYGRGLVNIEGLHINMSSQGLSTKRTTTLGDQFLSYITYSEVP